MPAANRFRQVVFGFAFLCAFAGVSLAADLPRYQLRAGQKLVYEQKTHLTVQESAIEDLLATWKVYVVGQNADGSWRLVTAMTSGGKYHKGIEQMGVGALAEAGVYDLTADGTVTLVQGDDAVVGLAALFPRLPEDQKQLSAGWDDQTANHSRIEHLQAAATTRPGEIFSLVRTPVGGIVAVARRGAVGVYQIDLKRGLVIGADQTAKEPNTDRPSNGTLQLVSSEQIDPAIINSISKQAKTYMEAVAKYGAVLAGNQGMTAEKSAQAELDKAARQLTSLDWDDGVSGTTVAGENAMAPDPPKPDDVLNTAAPDWTTTGFDGQTHSMKDFRGKVVLLDFWYRDCPWCIREMPQLVQLSADYKDQPVVVIGMNIDSKASDAQFVIDAMRLPYLNVKAGEIVGKYPFAGGPTLVIVDRNGVMRNRLVGYDAMGREEIHAMVDSLLK
jgi:thiol-disulfide isomerase/thioredoxin